jgi:hypothetical protein
MPRANVTVSGGQQMQGSSGDVHPWTLRRPAGREKDVFPNYEALDSKDSTSMRKEQNEDTN